MTPIDLRYQKEVPSFPLPPHVIKSNLTSNQLAVYEALEQFGPMKNSEIKAHVGFSIESISQACRSLYNFGYITKYSGKLIRMQNGKRIMSYVWCVNGEETTERDC